MSDPPRCLVCAEKGWPFPVRGEVSLVRCTGCGLEWQHPLPLPGTLESLYGDDYFERWGATPAEFESVREMKRDTYSALLDRLKPHRPTGSLLDVGCALGYLVELAGERGYDAFGLDRNAAAIDRAPETLAARLHCGELDGQAFPGKAFDVITLVDVLEHVARPDRLLADCRARLEPGGVLVLIVPNAASFTRSLFRRYWPHYAPEHLYLFGPENLRRLIASSGYVLLDLKTGFRKTLMGSYLVSYATRVGGFVPAGLGRFGDWHLRLPTGEMLIIARAVA
ncbi:class I SAM-dependent methyltransferase [Myxococcota bacterium]|nr:class I SAM-dependent methyltransferase [Myxococcota bacterium]